MILEEMKERRKELGLTYEELAEKSGVPLSTVQKIFGGFTQSPNYRTVLALEEALNPEQSYYHIDEEPYPMVKEARASYLAKQDGAYTIKDIERLPKGVRCELWDGEMILLASPSDEHELAIGYLVGEFYSYVKKNRGNCRVYASNKGVKRKTDDRNYLLPDVSIKCTPSKTERDIPDFIVEVTSPSSEKRDLIGKTERYQILGVREYWIVFLQQKKVVVYDLENGAPIVFYTFDDIVPVGISQGKLQVDFRDLQDYLKKWER